MCPDSHYSPSLKPKTGLILFLDDTVCFNIVNVYCGTRGASSLEGGLIQGGVEETKRDTEHKDNIKSVWPRHFSITLSEETTIRA